MTDTLWQERLAELAEQDDASSFVVDDDLARGRERLRRRRVGELGVAGLVVVVLAGVVLVTGGPGRQTGAPPAATPPTAQTDVSPVTPSAAPSVVDSAVVPPNAPTTSAAPYAWIRTILERSDGPRSPFAKWRNRLFVTTASVLDPSGGHLSYANQGMTGGWDQQGVSMGIKMGWSQPGRSGEGLVQVEVSSQKGADDARCRIAAGFGCPQAVRVGGRTVHVGEYASAYVVAFRQKDGDGVIVLVDTTFGNESAQGVDHLGFTRDDVYRLVQDARLDLPSR